MWNGTAAILNPSPARNRIRARTSSGWPPSPTVFRAPWMASRFVVPVSANTSDMPNRISADENAPRMKYFSEASVARDWALR